MATQENLHQVDSHRRFTTNLGVIVRTGPLGVHCKELGARLSPRGPHFLGVKKNCGGTFLPTSMGSQHTFIVGDVIELLEALERVWPVLHNALSFNAFPKTFLSPNKACQKIGNKKTF